eukprot:SAG22_NODE_70_length_22717_cov_12.413741_13_plen_99_part_00
MCTLITPIITGPNHLKYVKLHTLVCTHYETSAFYRIYINCTVHTRSGTSDPFTDLNDARGVGLRHDGADLPGRMEAKGNGAPPQERIQTCQTSPTSCR